MYQLLIMWILSITLNTQRKLGRFWDNLYFWFYGLVWWKGKGIVFSNPYILYFKLGIHSDQQVWCMKGLQVHCQVSS